ncbi:MAG: hypothetical protein LBU65_06515 [Planctomycetaceae bacterium]|jgi:DNA-directed RNA polymerase subunit RPC12/RpoP|nr:hypothetical protein [Planctomycetaceae bacterium]
MFSIICTTCDARIIVKNEQLIGKIVACPKCGGMVLVEPQIAENFAPPQSSVVLPDTLPTPAIPQPNIPRVLESRVSLPPDISESELKTRKIMLAVLAGLAIVLLLTVLSLVFLGDRPVVSDVGNDDENDPLPIVVEEFVDEPVVVQNNNPPVDEPITETPIKTTEQPVAESVPDSSEQPAVTVITSPAEELENEPFASPSGDEFHDRLTELLMLKNGGNVIENVAPRFNLLLRSLAFEDVKLLEVARFFESLVDVPFTFDLESMRGTNVTLDTPLKISKGETIVWDALTELFEPLGLTAKIEGSQLTISAEQQVTLHKYDITDLTEFYPPEQIRSILTTLSLPVTISDETTPVTVLLNGDAATDSLVLRTLDTLRIINGSEPKSKIPRDELSPETFGWDTVQKKITLNYIKPTPLTEAFKLLEKTVSMNIVVDHRALHRSGVNLKRLTSTVFANGTIDDALTGLLGAAEPQALTYRIIDEHTIEVTMPDDASTQNKMSVELHRLKLLTDETAEMFIDQVRTTFGQDGWENGAVIIQVADEYIIMRHSQPLQRELRRIIGDRERGKE